MKKIDNILLIFSALQIQSVALSCSDLKTKIENINTVREILIINDNYNQVAEFIESPLINNVVHIKAIKPLDTFRINTDSTFIYPNSNFLVPCKLIRGDTIHINPYLKDRFLINKSNRDIKYLNIFLDSDSTVFDDSGIKTLTQLEKFYSKDNTRLDSIYKKGSINQLSYLQLRQILKFSYLKNKYRFNQLLPSEIIKGCVNDDFIEELNYQNLMFYAVAKDEKSLYNTYNKAGLMLRGKTKDLIQYRTLMNAIDNTDDSLKEISDDFLKNSNWDTLKVITQKNILPQLSINNDEPEILFTESMTKINIDSLLKFSPKRFTLFKFWATWCVPCIEELPSFYRVAEKYSTSTQSILISVDTKYLTWKEGLLKYKLPNLNNYLIANINKSSLIKRLKVKEIPRLILYDKNVDKFYNLPTLISEKVFIEKFESIVLKSQ